MKMIQIAERRVINLDHVVEAEWDNDELMLIMAAPGFEPATPHLVVLRGAIANGVWSLLLAPSVA